MPCGRSDFFMYAVLRGSPTDGESLRPEAHLARDFEKKT